MSFETLPGDGVNEDVHRYRYVGVSAGKLRFIEMVNVSSEEKAAVSVWTYCGDDNLFARWTRQSTTVFSEVWSHRSYLDTGLPQSVPEAIAFAHPLVPDNVFFIQHGHLIRLDVAAKRVVELTPDRCTSSSDFLPWIFPPSLASDFYPRYSGLLTLSGCQVHMMHLSQTDLLIQAEFLVVGNVRATAVQIVMRVWTKHKFNELVIIGNKDNHSSSSDQAISAVSFRRFALQPMRMTILPLKDAIIRVPVPVFGNIFRAYGLVEELISSTGPTVLQGKRIPRGYYIGGPWMVQFIEIHNVPADPVMLLMFYHHGFETFAAQLREWPNFHHVKIYQGSYRPDMYDVTLAYLEDSDEESIQDVPHAIRMVPLPFLSQISAYFDDE
ncbi:uncharacterized protein LOC107303957 [Oryza brachyantha]|nr:uncharacterized protein LOC107303957 [Oryza brachyantha]